MERDMEHGYTHDSHCNEKKKKYINTQRVHKEKKQNKLTNFKQLHKK